MQYNHQEIEKKWQEYWAKNKTFKAKNPSNDDNSSPSERLGEAYYVLDMFPYPSGAGLHVGHPLGYIASDIYARYKRHKGFNVLHPQGYDSFGLPAEQYAIQTGQHPAVTTETNIATYRKQLDRIGFSFDWSREVRTSDPKYYKWTQWIFIQLFHSWYNKEANKAEDIKTLVNIFSSEGNAKVKASCDENIELFSAKDWNSFSEEKQQEILLQYRLTYLSDTEVNWCPTLGTVLANDEIVNGVSERGGHPVVRKKMRQWSMRITTYAQRLLDGLEKIDWPQPLKDSQTNWIGRSEGAMVSFSILSPALSEGKVAKGRGYMTGGNNSHLLIEKAKENRNNPTEAESVLWQQLKGKKLEHKFRQQHLIDNFIVDFVCLTKKLIIEVDGKYHNEVKQIEKDKERTEILENLGYKVIRFTNEQVIGSIDSVLKTIKEKLSQAPLSSGKGLGDRIKVFTTRPDTIFGVSFMTLAPEHELVAKITTEKQRAEVEAYIKATAKRSERDRMADVKTISGVFTGAYALHPFTGKKIPIWIGDYVLASYGTGAVMAVPAGDERDYAFAKHFGIEIPDIFDLNPTPTLPQGEGANSSQLEKESYAKNDFGYLTANPILANKLVEFARENRKKPTEAEDTMWQSLRKKQLGYRIRRQHYIANFLVDFVCLKKQLVIEIDGEIHKEQQEYDKERTYLLNELGFKVIRFTNEEVLLSTNKVLNKIKDNLNNRPNFVDNNSPSLGGGEGEVKEAYTDKTAKTPLKNSDFLNGLTVKKAMKTVIYEMEKQGLGYGKINYRLRDAVFSRQRYWGEPFPVYYKNGLPQMIDEKYLPIELPEVEKYLPTEDGKPPLGNATTWAWCTTTNQIVSNDKIDDKTIFPLELNTMPGWAGSSQYFNRYMDSANDNAIFSKEAVNYWKDVDLYIGGSEHATGHLLYARFWQKFMFDKGLVPVDEFAKKLINQGMILGTSAFVYRKEGTNTFLSKGMIEGEKVQPIHADVSFVNTSDELDIEAFKNWREDFKNAQFICEKDGTFKVDREVEKMSKSKYNVVNPDDICEEYGADSLRLFEMFLGPLEQSKPWKTSGISGVYSFLKKLWKLYHSGENGAFYVDNNSPSDKLAESFKTLHKTIKKVEEDIENFSFNTSVSTFMIAVNELTTQKCNNKAILEPLLVLISPYAPHIAEELWSKLGNKESVAFASFPKFEEKYLVESTKNYPISFNGKMRFTLELPLDMSKEEIEKAVMENEKTKAQLQGKEPKRVIVVPGKIVNIVG